MKKITLKTKNNNIPIFIGNKIVSKKMFSALIKGKDVLIITNKTVGKLYLNKIKKLLPSFTVKFIQLSDGEKYKNISVFSKIQDFMIKNNFDRDVTVIALGGGVIGDLVGFVASTFMRGVKLIHIPTTLLAQVDSSIGGKTAINHPNGKNLIGSFYQPNCVIIDTEFLKTLPEKEFTSGLAEVIKYGVIKNHKFLRWLNNHANEIINKKKSILLKIVEISAKEKVNVVTKDEHESDVRAFLNFGHTLGHAIEASMKYKNILHGEAISIGMLYASMLSVEKNNLSIEDFNLIESTLKKLKLPTKVPTKITNKNLIKHMSFDKKKKGGKNRFVLLERIGFCVINTTIKEKYLEEMLKVFRG